MVHGVLCCDISILSSDEGSRRVANVPAEEVNLSGALFRKKKHGLLLDEPLERSIKLDAEGANRQCR